MPAPTRRQRFTRAKCQRCGKTTLARQNGVGDLYALPHEWPAPLSDAGAFCERCIRRYSQAERAAWFTQQGK